MADRALDVVVFGATGFTGRMVARYFAERNPEPGLRWGIAGRSQNKLAGLAQELGTPDLPQIVADSADRQSLDALAAQTHVVATTVGPFARYGSELVAACVEAGTHYCDITGEAQFVRRMIDAHQTAAQQAGVRIVHCCGFDSIPSDLGVFNLQQASIEQFGAPFEEVEAVYWGVRGSVSGGTIASMTHILEEASDRDTRRILAHPYSLVPGGGGPKQVWQRGTRYSQRGGVWTGPFVMAVVNEKVVRRSNALLDYRYGENFSYGESMKMGRGIRGRVSASLFSAGFLGGVGLLAIPPVRRLAQRTVLPSPGDGPTDEAIEAGFFRLRVFGHRAGGDPAKRLQLVVNGKRDPGYGATACMLAESAICLSRNPDLPMAGVLTPASAMGDALTERLNKTDVQFALEPE